MSKFPAAKQKDLPPACIETLEARIAPATFTVRNLHAGGGGSLAAAINAANDAEGADTIKFKPGLKGTINLRNDLPDITDDLTIIGRGAGRLGINGAGLHELIHIEGTGLEVSIEKLKLRGGRAEQGGGVFIDNADGNVTISKCVITGNRAVAIITDYDSIDYGRGGAINNLAGTVTLDQVTITGNKADQGGGVANFGTMTVTASKISGNRVGGFAAYGGGFYNGGEATLTIMSSKISGNTAQGIKGVEGGVGYKGANGYAGEPGYDGANGYDGDFGDTGGDGGTAAGGGVFNGGTVTIDASTISDNSAKGGDGGRGGAGGNGGKGGAAGPGGGVRGYGGSGGDGGYGGSGGNGGGGGIFSSAASSATPPSVTVQDSTISGNTATGGAGGERGPGGSKGEGRGASNGGEYAPSDGANGERGEAGSASGGGIAATGSGQLTIEQVTIRQNVALNQGGGVYIDVTGATFTDCTISANRAGEIGGGLYVESSPDAAAVEVISTVISNNSAPVDPDVSGQINPNSNASFAKTGAGSGSLSAISFITRPLSPAFLEALLLARGAP